MMIGTVKRGVAGVFVAAMVIVGWGAASASAASPWWHLTTNLRPSSIRPGHAKDEVLQLRVEGTEGRYVLEGEGENFARVGVGATSQELQEKLEVIYGSGNVEVTGGPGEDGGAPYEIKFVDGMEDRPVVLSLRASAVFRKNETEEGRVTLKELTRGASDGVIVLTAVNLGDADAAPEEAPVTLSDILPAGLKPVAVEGTTDEGLEAFGDNSYPLFCSLGSVSCTFTGIEAPGSPSFPPPNRYPAFVPPYYQLQMRIRVNAVDASTGEVNAAKITGGGAPESSITRPIVVGDGSPFGVDTYEVRPEEEGGGIDTQAGSHPFQLTTT